MLIDRNYTIKWGTKNKRWFMSRGYPFTAFGDEFSVSVKDLMPGSPIKVEAKCDYCGKTIYQSHRNYSLNYCKGLKDCCDDQHCVWNKKHEMESKGYCDADICVSTSKRDTYSVANEFYDKGLLLLDEYVDTRQRLAYICLKHPFCGIQYITYDRFKLERYICRGCTAETSNIHKYTIDFANEVFLEKGYWLLEWEYNNCDEDMKYICSKHENYGVQKATLFNALNYENNCIMCEREKNSGEYHWHYKGGISSATEQFKAKIEYKRWRESVLDRDYYACQCCGSKHDLHVHHINNFADNPELRIDVDNGITLCEKCHGLNHMYSFHNVYGPRGNTPEQLEEYLDLYKRGVIDKVRQSTSA